jgi:hypothetical protein
MQASKIHVGEVYAIRLGGELARFRVLATHTTRNVSGTSTKVEGELLDAVGGLVVGHRLTYEPGNIIGNYGEVAELVAKEQAERDKRKADAQRERDRAEAVFTAFCKLINIPKPKRVKEYRHQEPNYAHNAPFRLDYSNTISLNREGMEILARFFKIDDQQQEERTNIINLSA